MADIKDITPRQGTSPRKTTDKKGGMVDPIAKIGPSRFNPRFGEVPHPNAQPPRETPTDTNPRLLDGKVEPVITRATPKARTDGPF